MKRTVDRAKKSRCDHCLFYNKRIYCCQRNPKVNLSIPYWRKCDYFVWKENEEVSDKEGVIWRTILNTTTMLPSS